MRLPGVLAAAIAFALVASSSPAHGGAFSARVAAQLQAARAPLAQLGQTSERRSLGATFVRVRQEVAGIPVLGADATLSLGMGGSMLLDHTRRAIASPAPARVSKAAAIGRARRAAHAGTLRARIQAGLAILPNGSHGRLVWRVVIPSAQPLGDFEVLIDARTRAAVRVRDLLQHASGQALVFDPNPVVEQGSRTGLADDGNKDSPALDALYRTVTLQDLDPTGCLSGAWVSTNLGRTGTCPTGRDFTSIRRASPCNCFEAAMAYFHIDRIQRYIQSLGFTNVVHRSIPVNLHATAQDNSFYSPTSLSLNFGDGGVNDAQDADVIAHEYGHAIQDSEIPGFGEPRESGAIGEGFGDYWQAAMSANLGLSEEFSVCFAEWDTTSVRPDAIPCLRRVDLQWTRSQAYAQCGGDEMIHCVGQAWSNLLWTIRKRLGGPAADRLVLQSHFSYTPTSGFRDAALALLFADRQLNGGANQSFLRDLLIGRGFLSDQQLDDQPSGAQPLAVPGQAAGQLNVSTDTRDVLAVPLTAGQGVVFRMRAGAGGAFALALYAPGTASIDTGAAVARTIRAGTEESLAFVPTASGTFYLVVEAASGSAGYTVQALVDTDHDGVADVSDDCPAVANGTQADWNRNGKGDACDRASKTTISRVTVRGRTLIVTGTIRPPDGRVSAWFVEVRKGRRLVAHARGARRKSAGRAVAVVRIPARVHGRLQVRALLRDPRYNRAASKTVTAIVS